MLEPVGVHLLDAGIVCTGRPPPHDFRFLSCKHSASPVRQLSPGKVSHPCTDQSIQQQATAFSAANTVQFLSDEVRQQSLSHRYTDHFTASNNKQQQKHGLTVFRAGAISTQTYSRRLWICEEALKLLEHYIILCVLPDASGERRQSGLGTSCFSGGPRTEKNSLCREACQPCREALLMGGLG